MKSSPSASTTRRPPSTFYGVRVPQAEERWLKELMERYEVNASQVLIRGIRRLAELEGLSTPSHRFKRST